MPDYVLTFRSTTSYDPSPQTRAAWQEYFAGLGDSVLELGRPVVAATTVGSCDDDDTRLGGYSIIEADDLDAAAAIAKASPAVARGGGVEIGELGPVPPVGLPTT
jgi:YCII-related domain-containing protein